MHFQTSEAEILRHGQIASRVLAVFDGCGQHRREYSPDNTHCCSIIANVGYIKKLADGDYPYKGKDAGHAPITRDDLMQEGFLKVDAKGKDYLELTKVLEAWYARTALNARVPSKTPPTMGSFATEQERTEADATYERQRESHNRAIVKQHLFANRELERYFHNSAGAQTFLQ